MNAGAPGRLAGWPDLFTSLEACDVVGFGVARLPEPFEHGFVVVPDSAMLDVMSTRVVVDDDICRPGDPT